MPRFGPLQEGIFRERVNRFLVRVDLPGEKVEAHLPNSGRLAELLRPGAPVMVRAVPMRTRKTAYDLVLVECRGGETAVTVCIDARLPGSLFLEGLARGLPQGLSGLVLRRREAAFLRSRLDFVLEGGAAGAVFVEVKSVTLVREGCALFPDAPSARGSRHLEDLAQAPSLGYGGAAVFVVQRPDAAAFRPNDAADPLFGRRLRQAVRRGVRVAALRCRVDSKGIEPWAEIPVLLD